MGKTLRRFYMTFVVACLSTGACFPIFANTNPTPSTLVQTPSGPSRDGCDAEVGIPKEKKTLGERAVGLTVDTALLATSISGAALVVFLVPDKFDVIAAFFAGTIFHPLANPANVPMEAAFNQFAWWVKRVILESFKRKFGGKVKVVERPTAPRIAAELEAISAALRAKYPDTFQLALDHITAVVNPIGQASAQAAEQFLRWQETSNPTRELIAYDLLAFEVILFRHFRDDIPANNTHIVRAIQARLRHLSVDPDKVLSAVKELLPIGVDSPSLDLEEVQIYRDIISAWITPKSIAPTPRDSYPPEDPNNTTLP